jgi:hypothetical protein
MTPGGPDACWEVHEAWRLGKDKPSSSSSGRVDRATIPPAPKPRWPSGNA